IVRLPHGEHGRRDAEDGGRPRPPGDRHRGRLRRHRPRAGAHGRPRRLRQDHPADRLMADGLKRVLRPLAARTLRALKTAEHWTIAQFARAVLMLLRLLPPERALAFADKVARKVGPRTSRHRVAVDNLRHAYPEKN